ncbi:MAG: hypothetical protein KDI83_10010 [Gammaproteobacteria bacterium]|nr:hypothetical protein [Gammaproteobacteria bacterium]
MDEDFGPLFIKFSSYLPFTVRIYLNGHEYAKHQLSKTGVAHEAHDNGICSCADPVRLQQDLEGLDATRIEAVVRKGFALLPHAFSAAGRPVKYVYELSILQAVFATPRCLIARCRAGIRLKK